MQNKQKYVLFLNSLAHIHIYIQTLLALYLAKNR